jgi:NTE family protein
MGALRCRRFWGVAAFALLMSLALTGCISVYNFPANQPLPQAAAAELSRFDSAEYEGQDDVLVALSFSGGGTRAAAFSFGVLQELERTRLGSRGKTLLDQVGFVSGVSGGSITAAYFGLKKRAALDDFRQRFLLRNAEEGLRTSVSLGNIGRALGGGVNDSQFSRWLDQNLFDGATFASFGARPRPWVWINASEPRSCSAR